MTIDSKMYAGYSTETVTVADGLALFCRKWEAVTPALASVLIVHGLGEHSGRYVHVGRYFAAAGFRTIAFDLRGHGRSPGRPVFVKRYAELASDVDCVVKHFSGGPSFLFGHSLGGQLVLWTAQHFQLGVAGLIVSAPWLALAFAPPRWQLLVAQKVNGLIPGLRFSTRIRSETLSRDQGHLDSLEDLDLLHKFSTVRLYLEAANAALEIRRTLLIDRPVLFSYGDADGVTSCQVAQDYFSRLQAPAKMFKIYPGLLHELHNEREREQVLADYVKWMKSMLPTRAG
jgi:alpha-beta hydrolase superfamily lysophospholipase